MLDQVDYFLQPVSHFDELPDDFDPSGKFPGSFDDGDPQTTNLYVGNLSPKVGIFFLSSNSDITYIFMSFRVVTLLMLVGGREFSFEDIWEVWTHCQCENNVATNRRRTETAEKLWLCCFHEQS